MSNEDLKHQLVNLERREQALRHEIARMAEDAVHNNLILEAKYRRALIDIEAALALERNDLVYDFSGTAAHCLFWIVVGNVIIEDCVRAAAK